MTRRSPSILFRTIWLHVFAWVGISVAISTAAYFLLDHTVNDFEGQLLRDHADTASQALTYSQGRWSVSLPADLQAVYAHGYGGYSLNIADEAGRPIYVSPRAESTVVDPRSVGRLVRERRGKSVYYAVSTRVERAGHIALIEVSQNLEHPDVIIDDVVARFLGPFILLAFPISIVVIAVDVWLMRRVFSPVIAASRVVSSLRPGRLIRLPVKGLPRELLPLAQAVNGAFDRLEEALQAQRDFAADAAHELRTPLSILRVHVDTTLDPKAAATLRTDIDAMGRIVDQLLQLAELEGFSAGGSEETDLVQIANAVVDKLAPISKTAGKTLQRPTAQGAVRVSGHPELIYRAVRNLVDNAIAYSASGTAIEIEVEKAGAIEVKDRGPGIRQEEREHIFKRFWRSERQYKGHAGLGLAIVARTAELYNGHVAFSDREGGGSIFSLRFPLASEPVEASSENT